MAYGSEWRGRRGGRDRGDRWESSRECTRGPWRDWSPGQAGWGGGRRGRGWPYGVGYERGSEGDFGEWEAGSPPGRGPYGPPWFAEPGPGTAPEPAHPPRYRRRASAPRRRPRDDEVRESVHECLFQDSWVSPGGIEVEVRDGVVTLRGRVKDHMEARFVVDDAWDAPGVRGVISDLRVQGEEG